MSEAFLVGNNGVRFKRLRVPVPPDKTTYLYFNGTIYEDEDLTGAKIVADIGRSEVTLTPDNYSAEMDITGETTAEWVIEATIGGTTRRVSIPLVLQVPDPILDNNSWEVISRVSAAGLADEIWSVGDIKTETINGTLKSFRVIGFDHDVINAEDDKYGTDYNGGSGYAGITFQTTEEWSSEGSKMKTQSTNVGGWISTEMRTTTMPLVYDSFTSDMKAVIRTTNKKTACYDSVTNTDIMMDSADKVFLLAEKEVLTGSTSHSASVEKTELSQYVWYAENQYDCALSDNKSEWLRSTHDKSVCTYHNHYLVARGDSDNKLTTSIGGANATMYYRPAFCV